MKLTTLDEDLRIHQKLEDEPNDVGGLSAQELKKKFDQAGVTIQKYLNETHLPEEEKAVADALSEAKGYTDQKTAALGQGNMKQTVYDTKKRNRDVFDYTDEKLQELTAKKLGGGWLFEGDCSVYATTGMINTVTEFTEKVDPDGLWSETEKAFVVPEGGRVALFWLKANGVKADRTVPYLRIRVNGAERAMREMIFNSTFSWAQETVMIPVVVKAGDRVTVEVEAFREQDAQGVSQVDLRQVAMIILM